jgi:hypothetical protein
VISNGPALRGTAVSVLTMMPAPVAGQVLALTPIGGFLLSTLIIGGASPATSYSASC